MIVVLILVVVMTIAMISADDSAAEVRIGIQDELKSVFNNAAVRSQAFNNEVVLLFKPDVDGFFTCSLKSKKSKSLLTTVPEDESEEEALARAEVEGSVYAWSGADTYESFGNSAQLYEFEDLLNEEEFIPYHFYPDGEATGPVLKLKILDRDYELTVGRLNGQLQMTEIEF